MISTILCIFGIASSLAHAEGLPTAKISWIKSESAPLTVKIPGRFVPQPGAVFSERAPATGTVKKIEVHEGQLIKAGSPLMEITSSECTKTDSCEAFATRGGVVGKIMKKLGTPVRRDEALMEILAPQDISVRLDSPRKYLKYISPGQTLATWYSDQPEKRLQARVAEILPAIGNDEPTQGVRLTPQFQIARDKLDSPLTVEIPIPSEKTTAIPPSAVGFYDGHHFVIKKTKDKLEAVPIHILSESSERLWIRPTEDKRLSEGDDILSAQVIFILPKLFSQARAE